MPRPTRAEARRRALARTAYHEAGHAVVCIGLETRFKLATIVAEEDSLGHLLHERFCRRFRPDLQMTPRTERFLDRHVLIALAGEAAVLRTTQRAGCVGGSR